MRYVTFRVPVDDLYDPDFCSNCPFKYEQSDYNEDYGYDTYQCCTLDDKCPEILDDGYNWYTPSEKLPNGDNKFYYALFTDEGKEHKAWVLFKDGKFYAYGVETNEVIKWGEVRND